MSRREVSQRLPHRKARPARKRRSYHSTHFESATRERIPNGGIRNLCVPFLNCFRPGSSRRIFLLTG
jgi:hypothetical protein